MQIGDVLHAGIGELLIIKSSANNLSIIKNNTVTKTSAMTKLLEWVSVLSAGFAVWYSLVGGYVKLPLLEKYMNIVLISPILFVILFGLYAVAAVLYRVFTFNNCEDAAKELQAEIVEAKRELQEKGLRW